MDKATDAELTAALTAFDFDRFMRVLPPEWRLKLEARAGGQLISRVKAQHPGLRMRHVNRKHLALVPSVEPPTSH